MASASDNWDEFIPEGKFVKDFGEATSKRAPRTSPPPKKQKPLPPWKDGVISAWATNLYTVSGQLVESFDTDYGMALQTIAVPAGNAWEGVAKNSPALRRIIHQLMTTTQFSELIMAHIPLVVVIMHKHGPMRHMFEEVEEEVMSETNGATAHAVG